MENIKKNFLIRFIFSGISTIPSEYEIEDIMPEPCLGYLDMKYSLLINFFETLNHSSRFVFLTIEKSVLIFSDVIFNIVEPINFKIKGLTTNANSNCTETGLPGKQTI